MLYDLRGVAETLIYTFYNFKIIFFFKKGLTREARALSVDNHVNKFNILNQAEGYSTVRPLLLFLNSLNLVILSAVQCYSSYVSK